MIMSSSRHQDALSAFEEDDSLAVGIQSKIASFQKKQKKEGKQRKDYYDWIHTQRNLVASEAATSKQILEACTNVLELLQKEQCETGPSSRADAAIKLVQHDIATLKEPSTPFFQEKDFMSAVDGVGCHEHSTTKGEAGDGQPHYCRLLLDLRENLTASLENIDEQYATLSKDTEEHRRQAMLLLSNGQNSMMKHELPETLSKALDALRAQLQSGDHVDGDCEIDMLEHDLRRDFEDAHREYDSVLSQISSQNKVKHPCWDEKSHIIFKKALCSSNGNTLSTNLLLERLKKDLPGKPEQEIMQYLEHHRAKKTNKHRAEAAARDLAKKTQVMESNGLRQVARLGEEINTRARRSKAKIEKEMKSKEMDLRLEAMRLEREDAQKDNADKLKQAIARKVGKEIHRTKRILEAKQALHQMQQATGQKENCINELQDDFAVEIQTLKHQQTRSERTFYRQEQMKIKRMAQMQAEDEAIRAEEIRLEKLNSLAASTPYYKSIMDKTSDIHKSTEARKNDVYGGRSDLADFQSGKLKSFTEDKIFSDSKFRLGNALHEAGLANSIYARDVVRNVIPRVEARTTGIKPY